MTGFVLLDVALGVLYIFLAFSLVASAIQEAIAGLFRWRSDALRAAARQLLDKKFDDIWDSPLINVLKGPGYRFNAVGRRDPSYIKGAHFARAVIDKLDLGDKSPREILEHLDAKQSDLGETLHTWLKTAIKGAGDKADAVETAIATYFDEVMERVSGWYVRRAKFTLVVIGFCLAATTNFNMFDYAGTLFRDQDARDVVAAKAMQIAELKDIVEASASIGLPVVENAVAAKIEDLDSYVEILLEENQGIGWSHCAAETQSTFACVQGTLLEGTPVLSWLLIAFAVMLGAQFWFDLLKGLVSLRAAGKKADPKT